MQTNKEFEDFFREHLNGLEETPPAGAWKKIAKDLKPRRNYYWQMAAGLLLLLFSAVVLLGLRKQAKTGPETPIATTGNQAAPTQNQRVIASAAKSKTTAPATDNTPANAAPSAGEPAKAEVATAPATGTSKAVGSPAGTGNRAVSGRETPVKGALALAGTKTRQPVKSATSEAGSNSQPSETTDPNAQTNTKLVNPTGVLASGKPYGKTVKKSAAAFAAQPEAAVATARETAKETAGTPASASGVINPAKEMAKGSETTTGETITTTPEIALNQPARTDSVALNTIPQPAADQPEAVALADERKEKKDRRTAISVKFTPGIIARRLSANPDDDQYVRFTDNKQSKRPADLGYDVSATLHHRISPKTTLDGSFAYTRLRSNVNYSVSNGQIKVVSHSAPGDTSSMVKVEYIFAEKESRKELVYGSFRAGLTQELVKSGHNTFFAGGGAGLNMLLSKSGQIHTEPETVSGQPTQRSLGSKAFHNVNSHVYLNCGLAKEIMPQVSVLIAPAFTYYLSSVLTAQEAFKLKPYTFGLNFGLHYQF